MTSNVCRKVVAAGISLAVVFASVSHAQEEADGRQLLNNFVNDVHTLSGRFEQQLVEAVMGAQSLRHSTEWTSEQIQDLWTQEALTAVVLPRYHIDMECKRTLGAKIGGFKDEVAS